MEAATEKRARRCVRNVVHAERMGLVTAAVDVATFEWVVQDSRGQVSRLAFRDICDARIKLRPPRRVTHA